MAIAWYFLINTELLSIRVHKEIYIYLYSISAIVERIDTNKQAGAKLSNETYLEDGKYIDWVVCQYIYINVRCSPPVSSLILGCSH